MQNNDTVLFVSPGPDLKNPASGEGTRLRNLSLELSEYGWQVFTLVPEKTDDTTLDWVTKQYRYRQWSLISPKNILSDFADEFQKESKIIIPALF